MVHLIHDAPSTPQEESPGSRDSAASVASVAERRRDASDEPVKPLAKESSHLDVKHEKQIMESAERVAMAEEVRDEKRSKEKTSALKDRQDVDSRNKSDSVDSIPSVASAPRVMIPATGSEASDFRASVLSAIEEVAFFPKKGPAKRGGTGRWWFNLPFTQRRIDYRLDPGKALRIGGTRSCRSAYHPASL